MSPPLDLQRLTDITPTNPQKLRSIEYTLHIGGLWQPAELRLRQTHASPGEFQAQIILSEKAVESIPQKITTHNQQVRTNLHH
jgi:hypothetical protein